WNLQQWKVIVAHSDEAKEKLYEAANKQIKIKESSATFIVLGDLNAHNTIGDIADDWIKHNHIHAEKREGLIQSVNTFFEDEKNKRYVPVCGALLSVMIIMLISENEVYAA